MHLNKSTWGSGDKHGANNANVKRYIDFAAKNGFGGVLVEGWNQGWDGDWIANGKHFSFTESYPDFDLPQLAAYARERGVRLIGHNETAGALENYERQLEAAMALYAEERRQRGQDRLRETQWFHRAHARRTAAVGHEWFAGQYRVRHELKVAEVAAEHRISIDAHEPVKDTGLRRTWPNMLSREGARGQEFNAWGRPTNPPEHLTILPFTRLLAGPMDFTPGIFDLTFGKTDINERVQSTLATQLALYVLVYSPVHMAADLPENYEKRPDAFQFIRDVPTDWETSRTLAGRDRRLRGDRAPAARRGATGISARPPTRTRASSASRSISSSPASATKRRSIATRRARTTAPIPTALAIEKRRVTSKDRSMRRWRPAAAWRCASARSNYIAVRAVPVSRTRSTASPARNQPTAAMTNAYEGSPPATTSSSQPSTAAASSCGITMKMLKMPDVHAHLSRRQVVGEHGVGQAR